MRAASRQSAHNSSDLHWIKFTNHDPWNNEESHGAGDHKKEDTRNRNPRVLWKFIICIPHWFVIHIDTKSQHREAASNTWNEGQWSPATSSEWNARNYCEEEPQSSQDDGAEIKIERRATFPENIDGIESDGVDTTELIHHKINDENSEGLQTRRCHQGLKDFIKRRLSAIKK